MTIQDTPLISVIVPVYQMEAYLEECVDSILAQTYGYFELWLIDDGSCDCSASICDEYARKDQRVHVVHQRNRGLSAARNVGLERATGEYIAHIDADDTVDKVYLETLLSLCRIHKVQMAACNHRIVRENGRSNTRFNENEKERKISFREACKGILYHGIPDVSTWGKLFHRSLFETIRYPEGRLYEDTAVIAQLVIKAKELAYTSDPMYSYRIRQNSISRASFSMEKMDFVWAVEEMTDQVLVACPDMKSGWRRRRVHAALSVRRYFVDCGPELKEQRDQLEKYVRHYGPKVCLDYCAPIRDKIAITAVFMGSFWYDLLWKLFQRM